MISQDETAEIVIAVKTHKMTDIRTDRQTDRHNKTDKTDRRLSLIHI